MSHPFDASDRSAQPRDGDALAPEEAADRAAAATADPLRPSDHVDGSGPAVGQPRLGPVGWLRWMWRQLTSMRTALFLLLLLALAAVPGSLVPQRSSDPNGVTQYFIDNPDLAPTLDWFQMFDVYTSIWFSSIYLLLFISLIGCVVPRTRHHLQALRAAPPRTPAKLTRLPGYLTQDAPTGVTADAAMDEAQAALRRAGYRTLRVEGSRGRGPSVSAERGYLRETGNLVFHGALVGVLATVAIGGGMGYSGQRVIVEDGQAFVNALLSYDSFNPGRFFDPESLEPFSMQLESFEAEYETKVEGAFGLPLDYTATVRTQMQGSDEVETHQIKVNDPLRYAGSDIFLLGNGYAPTITVRDPDGNVVFTDSVPFLPQDTNLTSLGIVKVPDGLAEQLGMIGFFYPTQEVSATGAYYSSYPGAEYPVLTLNVYEGDLGINEGVPKSVYALDTDTLSQLTGGDTGVDSVELMPGQTAELPNGLGTVSLDGVERFVSLDIHRDPTQGWILAFVILMLAGLLTSLFVPRRRVWVRANPDGELEYAALARGEDPRLEAAVADLAQKHLARLAPAEADEHEPKS